MPSNSDLHIDSSNRFLKSPFANVAPRADHVRNNVNGEIHCYSIVTNGASCFSGRSRSS